jgi:hypothetical protein
MITINKKQECLNKAYRGLKIAKDNQKQYMEYGEIIESSLELL